MMPYQIIEVANCHGGDYNYLMELIESFETYKSGYGIKFQPFKYDSIATENFSWFGVYKELFFDENQWKSIIVKAGESKDVWLDLFDSYGIQILKTNFDAIAGIKLQASVLFNYKLIDELSRLDLSTTRLIINVSSYSVESIKEVLLKIDSDLNPHEVYLEIGFQSYPTQLEDSGLSKIEILRANFSNKIVFADHVSGESEDTVWLPLIASLLKVDVIEKHVMLDKDRTKYDHFSSISPHVYDQYISRLQKYAALLTEPFINERENLYVKNSILIPILASDRPAACAISLIDDLKYQRSGSTGLNARQVKKFIDDYYVLSRALVAGSPIRREDLRPANIAVIIACRLKSSRLKRKALLNIGEVTSVERCIKSALKFDHVNQIILATSTLEEDAALVDYTYSPAVYFHRGDPDDVIQRYLDAATACRTDVVIRVTADMPYVDNEILQILLLAHFETGADYTVAEKAAVGTNLEIINVNALQTIKKFFPKANYSEYMTWYFQNNAEYFKLNFVKLPDELVRDYRLTLDYQEDLDMFNKIEEHFASQAKGDYGLRDIFNFLDTHPEIASLNSGLTLRYKTDQTLIDTLNRETRIK